MLEQRNAFINDMCNKFISQKQKFQNILDKIGWTHQSLSGAVKEEQSDEQYNELSNPKVWNCLDRNQPNLKGFEEKERLKNSIQDMNEMEGCSFSLIGIQSRRTSGDHEKRYNELLASLSFQPKQKKEKLSDTQLLASLLETERNAKRRRISYRNKVHTKNKSHTEVLREVIQEQMEVLKDEVNNEGNIDGTNKKKDEEDEMIEVRVTDGNPHYAWRNVSLVLGIPQRERGKRHDNQRSDRVGSNNRRSSSDHQKHKHRSKHSRKHRKSISPSHSDKSPNYSSKHSRDKLSSRKRHKSRKRSKDR